MKQKKGTFNGADQLPMYYQAWLPDTAPKAVLAIVHGVGEHSGRYMNVVNGLVPHGIAVYGMDNRGHGRSPGNRGHVDSFAQYREDVHAFLATVRQEQTAPLFLFGHSLGGLIVLNTVLHRVPDGIAGIIASAPALRSEGISAALLAVGRVMSKIWPGLTLESGLDDTAVSRDTAVIDAYKEDPLVHSKGSARMSTEAVDAMAWSMANASRLKAPPLLITHGDADRLTVPAASREFFEAAPVTDKTYIAYPGGYHESHNDFGFEEAVANIKNWIEARI